MAGIVRFGVSLEKGLLDKFDRLMRRKGYGNRSKALADIVREKLIVQEWAEGKEVVGTITMIYNHHQRELTSRLLDIQHHYYTEILSSQHIHLDQCNCLEVVVVRGVPGKIKALADQLGACRGVKHLQVTMSSTGKGIE
ncbi:MAG: nickel-responsive transcriptional regulator NikR [Candidatus Aureabacteria bacterium]|nr:nickel-responsive transcriptional regulator NikR [Candidatus Auribacterota bacterium]